MKMLVYDRVAQATQRILDEGIVGGRPGVLTRLRAALSALWRALFVSE